MTLTVTLLTFLLFVSAALASPSEETHGFAVFRAAPDDGEALKQHLRPLIAATRAEPGNLYYRMFTNPTQPGLIGFTEAYKNAAALQTHLTSAHVLSTFRQPYAQGLIVNRTLYGPWKEVEAEDDEDEPIDMTVYWQVNCSAPHVWGIIANWSDASWVAGSPNTTIVPLHPNGTVMSDQEAAKLGPVDPKGGLAPVVQRRTWPSGYSLDVRMLARDDEKLVTVQQIVTDLVFPNVTFDQFNVTISLHSDGLDSDSQSRIRYHLRATVKRGTKQMARQTLADDFYGTRIAFYQKAWNCTGGMQLKAADRALRRLHASFGRDERNALIERAFADPAVGRRYMARTLGAKGPPAGATVAVRVAVPPVVTPQLEAVAVEDVVISSLSSTVVRPRIVRYHFDAWARVTKAQVFDVPSTPEDASASCAAHAKELVDATERYYKVLAGGDIEAVRRLYAEKPLLTDPAGFAPPRTFDSVYTNFYKLADSFKFVRYPARSFVDPKGRQTVQLIDASFVLANGGGALKATPVQFLTFDSALRITKFEAYFKPQRIDFSKLK